MRKAGFWQRVFEFMAAHGRVLDSRRSNEMLLNRFASEHASHRADIEAEYCIHLVFRIRF